MFGGMIPMEEAKASGGTVLVRTSLGRIQAVAIDEETTIGDLLSMLADHTKYQIIETEYDVFGRITSTKLVDLESLAIFYCLSPEPQSDDQLESSLPDSKEYQVESMDGAESQDENQSEGQDNSQDNSQNNSQNNSQDETTLEQVQEMLPVEPIYNLRDCKLWLVERDSRVRVFFNPYIRMVLGLPMWYLDLYTSKEERALHLEMLIRTALGLGPDETRFSLYGNYRSHVSIIDGGEVVQALRAQEDPSNEKFWQYMMRPECETQGHLGISRESALFLHQKGIRPGARKYWFSLQGTTLFYFHNPTNRYWRKSIPNIDQCKIIYRGGNSGKTIFTFDLINPDGTRHRLKSHSRRRVEKWIRSLQSCHRSCEINEPITMEILKELTRPHLDPPPFFELVDNYKNPIKPFNPISGQTALIGGGGTAKFNLGNNDQPSPTTIGISEVSAAAGAATATTLVAPLITNTSTITPESAIGKAEKLLCRIEGGAVAFSTCKKVRRKEALSWIETLRLFMLTILRFDDRPTFIAEILPELKLLVREVQNFAQLVNGSSEFVPNAYLNGDFTDAIIESSNYLLNLFRSTMEDVSIGGNVDGEEANDRAAVRESRLVMKKLRRQLKGSILHIRLDNLPKLKSAGEREKESKKKETEGGGGGSLFTWWDRVISKRNVKIPIDEVCELSITESQTEPDSPVKLESNNHHHHHHPCPKPPTPKSVQDRHLERKEQYWQKAQKLQKATDDDGGGEKSPQTLLWKFPRLRRHHQRSTSAATFDSTEPQHSSSPTFCTGGRFDNEKFKGEEDTMHKTRHDGGRRHMISKSMIVDPTKKGNLMNDTSFYSSTWWKSTKNNDNPRESYSCTPSTFSLPKTLIDETAGSGGGSNLGVKAVDSLNGTCNSPSIIDNYDGQIPSKGSTLGNNPKPSLKCNPFTKGSSLSHLRSHSLRSATLKVPPPPPPPVEERPSPRPVVVANKKGGGSHLQPRPKSMVEIDQVLLSALLKDPRLAKLVNPQENPIEDGLVVRSYLSQPNSPQAIVMDPFECHTCQVCKLEIESTIEMLKTPFATFHQDCLRCDSCGVSLNPRSFRLEADRPFCRNQCGFNPNLKPLKSILKKASCT